MALNGKERQVLQSMANSIRGVGAKAAEMDGQGNYKSYHAEASRLMDSPDYRKGYEYCRDRVFEYLKQLGIEIEPV